MEIGLVVVDLVVGRCLNNNKQQASTNKQKNLKS